MRDKYTVEITNRAIEMLRDIRKRHGKRTYEILRDLILDLESKPALKGQPLTGPLHGLFSLHYSRFRVVYMVENNRARVLVVAAGHHSSGERDDIYQILKRMVESGQIEIKTDKK